MNNHQAHVLIVEDESAIREMIQFALRRAGMDVDAAADAREALTCINAINYTPDGGRIDVVWEGAHQARLGQ